MSSSRPLSSLSFPLPRHRSDEQLLQTSNPPDPNASVTLPPEILDKILEHVPITGEGRRMLAACALVATWWTGPCQRRLYSSVSIHGGNYERWMNGVVTPGSKTHLLDHVRSLEHCRVVYCPTMRDLAWGSGEYFLALRNLQSLTLSSIKIEYIGDDQFPTRFSSFRETLTYLSFSTLIASFGALVALVNYFPNVATLELHRFILEPDEGPISSSSRPLRGRKLHIHEVLSNHSESFNRFSESNLEYEELVIDSHFPLGTKFLDRALQISTGTVKFLRLAAYLRRE